VFEALDQFRGSVPNGYRLKRGAIPRRVGGLTARHALSPTSNPKFSFGLGIFVLPHSGTSR
jgi:hypothetical protein